MLRKTSHEETPIQAKVVTDTFTETKILVPIEVTKVTGKIATVRLGKTYHAVHEGDTLTVELDLDGARIIPR